MDIVCRCCVPISRFQYLLPTDRTTKDDFTITPTLTANTHRSPVLRDIILILSSIILLLVLANLIYVSVLFAGANQPRVRQVALVLLISACRMPEVTAVPIPVEATFADLLAMLPHLLFGFATAFANALMDGVPGAAVF